MNLTEQILFTVITSSILNKKTDIKLIGTKVQLESVFNALKATKEFLSEVNNSNSTTKSIMEKLMSKHRAINEFEKTFNMKWPL